MAKKKYLVLGNYGNMNIGDETLLKEVAFEILEKNKREETEILVPVRNPQAIEGYHSDLRGVLKPFYLFNVIKLIFYSLMSKKIIVGGGGIWSGYTGPAAKVLPVYLFVLGIIGKKIHIRGIGLYSTSKIFEKMLVNLAFMVCTEIEVRDDESFNNLWAINQNRAKKVPDLAIQMFKRKNIADLENQFPNKSLKLDKGEKIIIGISIKPVKNMKHNEKIVNEFADYINFMNMSKPDYLFVFLPFAKTNSSIEDDISLINKVIKRLKRKNNILVLAHNNPLKWYFTIKNKMNLVIGMRLHSLIFAHEAGKNIIAIPYENKIIQYLKEIRKKEHITLENLSSHQLIKLTGKYVK